jgi:hypothetical protein
MKYSASITQEQYIRVSPEKRITISPKGGDLSDGDLKLVRESAYGKQLIDNGILKIEGVKAEQSSVSIEGRSKTKDVVEIKKETEK